ncbi:MAG: M56 family metallopeptidase, partial [Planctomycetota bacterium]
MPTKTTAAAPAASMPAAPFPDSGSVAVDESRFDYGKGVAPQPVASVSAGVESDGYVAPQPTRSQASGNTGVGDRISWFGNLSIAFVGIWAAVSAWLLLRLGMAWRRLSRLVETAENADDETIELCQQLALKLHVMAPQVLRSPFIVSPCLTGLGIFRRPAILLPEESLELPMHNVLVHELSHLRRRDCHWNLLRQLATSAFFFQPLLWRLSRRIEETAEEVCDDFVVGNGGDREEYASRLVDLAELSTALAPAAVATAGVGIVSLRSMLARRVERITDTSRTLSTRVGSLLVLLVLIGGLAFTAVAGLVGLSTPTQAAVSSPDDEDKPNTAEAASVATASTATQSEAPKTVGESGDIIWRGIVRDAQGKPVAGADVYHAIITGKARVRQQWQKPFKTDSKGEFQIVRNTKEIGDAFDVPWRASAYAVKDGLGYAFGTIVPGNQSELRLFEDHPVSGRILDINGQPVVGTRLTILKSSFVENSDFERWRELASKPDTDFYELRALHQYAGQGKHLRSIIPPVVTDEKGRFSITGLGRGRIGRFLIEGPGIESTRIYIRTEAGDTVTVPMQSGMSRLRAVRYFPSQFDFVAGPSVPITGVVTTSDTGKPLAGIEVISQKRAGHNLAGWGEDFVRTKTDENGRFRLEGMPVGKDNVIAAVLGYGINPDRNRTPYLSVAKTVSTDGQSPQVEANLVVERGIWVAGQITDSVTGEGKRSSIQYFCASSNPESSKRRNGVDERETMRTGEDGNFRIAVLPGEGYLAILS